MLLTVSHAEQLDLPPFRTSLVSSPSHKCNKCRCVLLRVASDKHALLKYQINKLSTYKIKKNCSFTSRYSCVFYAVSCAAFFLHIKTGIKILISLS